jgi:hypothetical protein
MNIFAGTKRREEVKNIMAGLGLSVEQSKEIRFRGEGAYSGHPIVITYKDRLLTADDFQIELTIKGLKKNFTLADRTLMPPVLPKARLLTKDKTIDKHFLITRPSKEIYELKLAKEDITFILDNISLFEKIMIMTEGDKIKIHWSNFEKRIISLQEVRKLLDWLIKKCTE